MTELSWTMLALSAALAAPSDAAISSAISRLDMIVARR